MRRITGNNADRKLLPVAGQAVCQVMKPHEMFPMEPNEYFLMFVKTKGPAIIIAGIEMTRPYNNVIQYCMELYHQCSG